MKKVKQKMAAWASIFMLCTQYALVVPQVVHGETTDSPPTEQVETTEGAVQGIPGAGALKFAFKFLGKQSLKYGLLDIEKNSEDPRISSMATSALRLLVPSTMIFRELDQMQTQLEDISQQLNELSTTINRRFDELNQKNKLGEITTKRNLFHGISASYQKLQKNCDEVLSSYQEYTTNPTGANYQLFYIAYTGLMKSIGEGIDGDQFNFSTDLETLLRLLSPTQANLDNHNNYLDTIQSYAANTFAFRHQSYDVMASSYQEIVGYAIDYLMAYRTFTTIRVEQKKNELYSNTNQEKQIKLVSDMETFKGSYRDASERLLAAIEGSAEHYMVPIMGDYLSEEDRQVGINMNYVEERHTTTAGVRQSPYTEKTIDTAPVETFYRVQPIGNQISMSQPFGNTTKNYYILNHGMGTSEDIRLDIHRHRVYGLGGNDVVPIFGNYSFVNGDFFNLCKTRDDDIKAKMLPNPQSYQELFKMPSYNSNNDFINHLTTSGELPSNTISGPHRQWLFHYYTKPEQRQDNFLGAIRFYDAYIGMMDATKIDSEKEYTEEEIRILVEDLLKKDFAQENSDEPYLVILQEEKKEAYNLMADGENADLISFEIADEDRNDAGYVYSGSKVSIKINLPEARSGYKHEVTSLTMVSEGVEEIYSNKVKGEEDKLETFNESFEVPTEFLSAMPYNHTAVYVEYEEVKESYEIEMVTADEKGTLFPGYSTFTTTSYLHDQAEFDEKVEINVSPLEGYVASGVEVTTEDGTKVEATPVAASESGVPNIGGGVFAFDMPAGKVKVKPIYEKGIIVDLKAENYDGKLLEEEVMTFTDQHLWDTNLLDDSFSDGEKKEDIVTRGTFKKEADLHFTARSTGSYALKSITGFKPGNSKSVNIPLSETGKYQHKIPADVLDNLPEYAEPVYELKAEYLDFKTDSNRVEIVVGEGGKANFLGVSNGVSQLPYAEGETVKINIAPNGDRVFDGKKLTIAQADNVITNYQVEPTIDNEGNPRQELTFEKTAGATQVNINFTQENLVLLEGNYGSLRFKESNANREQYANGETIQVKLDPLAKFDKDSLQILSDGKVVVASDNVKYREDILSFKKPKTSAMITVKGDFEPYYAITKVIEEIGEGKNTFKTLDANGKERENWYEGEEVKLDFTDEEKAKLAQIRIIGETSGTVRVVNFTRESLNFTMPNEAVRIEVSFDNESSQTIVLPSQNDEGEYLLSSYNQLVTVSKLMSLSLKDNSYLEAKYVLDGFIDCQNKPLDTWGSSEKPFMGSLDGKGFSIVKLKVGRAGLIDTIGKSGVVKNFGILSVVLPQENQAGGYSGVVAGQNYGTIDNVYLGLAKETTHVIGGSARVYKRADLNQTLTANATDFGSVTGRNYGQLTNITNYFTLKSRNATEGIGGLVGRLAENSSLINSNNLGTMDVTKSAPGTANGGLVAVGAQGNLVMQNNYSHFTLVGSSDKLSPLMGNNLSIKADNYYADLAGDFPEGLGGTKLTSADMKSDTFAETLNGGVENNSNLKMWDRKEERDEQLPYLKGGHLKINQLSRQTMSSGIFTVTSHVPYDTTLQVTNLMKTKDAAVLMAAVQEGEIEELVDLSLQHPETQVKPHEDTEIKIDISQFVKTAENRSFKLLHQRGEKVEVVELTREGNYLVGKVNSLSPFALVSATTDEDIVVDETPTVPSDEGNRSSSKGILPKTGEKVTMSLAVVGMILCAGVVVYYFKRRNEKE
ncbi:LPXTG cell wall anchor domain-containing protein [Enterococcus asini]|uniref:LPXTG cell wall anchor domain-containing protein n=1 Tax=Enterococcus asini TaxID=57732 RepID=UPI00288E083B|nr:LPXTG cell wall anchor domain-containing protein [Enterococcus asini]MDT2757679.1 LPXTG cell wall anchor domain-containing protein [Enterococcus asini]